MSRKGLLPIEEALQEDNQKTQTVDTIKEILSKEYECISVMADENILQNLKREQIDIVVNLSNGLHGESKLAQLPALLEFINMPYTGSSIIGHSLAINKDLSSTIFKHYNIPTPNFKTVYSLEDLNELDLSFPILVKPNDEGSSRGIYQDSLTFDKDSLLRKMEEVLSLYTPPILLNEFVEGRELSVGVIGNGENISVLPIQEVDLSELEDTFKKFYSFEIKTYRKDKVKYHLPARLNSDEKKLVEETAIKAYKALQLRDYARVDIILSGGIPYVLEVNSLPGLQKEKSALYRMAEAGNIGYDKLIFAILNGAKERYKGKKL